MMFNPGIRINSTAQSRKLISNIVEDLLAKRPKSDYTISSVFLNNGRKSVELFTDEFCGEANNVSILEIGTKNMKKIRVAIGNNSGTMVIRKKPFASKTAKIVQKILDTLQELQPENFAKPLQVKTLNQNISPDVLLTEDMLTRMESISVGKITYPEFKLKSHFKSVMTKLPRSGASKYFPIDENYHFRLGKRLRVNPQDPSDIKSLIIRADLGKNKSVSYVIEGVQNCERQDSPFGPYNKL